MKTRFLEFQKTLLGDVNIVSKDCKYVKECFFLFLSQKPTEAIFDITFLKIVFDFMSPKLFLKLFR